MNLLMILLVLFISLYVVIKMTERFGKPMDPEKQAKLSNIALILIAVLLIARLLKEVF